MKTFKVLLLEELSEKQMDRVDSWGRSPAAVKISQHVIPKGQDRMVIPLEDPHDHKIQADPDVVNHLKTHGYELSDWRKGTATDKYGRDVNIGKILNKTNADPKTKAAFHLDNNRSNKELHDDLQVVISRHPYDVAGMSTGKRWVSCVGMDKESRGVSQDNSHVLEYDIRQGTHVAYLTKKGDDKALDPLARIALKPFREKGSDRVILHPEHKMYGTAASSFEHTVNSWVNKHFPLKDNTYYGKAKVYHDKGPTVLYRDA